MFEDVIADNSEINNVSSDQLISISDLSFQRKKSIFKSAFLEKDDRDEPEVKTDFKKFDEFIEENKIYNEELYHSFSDRVKYEDEKIFDFCEYNGEVIDINNNDGTFTTVFYDIRNPIKQTAVFDLDQINFYSQRENIEIGNRILIVIGKKRQYIRTAGLPKAIGDSNMIRITVRNDYDITETDKEKAREKTIRWSRLFSV